MADGDVTATTKQRQQIVQVQKKANGPWTEVATGDADSVALGAALLQARSIKAFRVLEVIATGTRTA